MTRHKRMIENDDGWCDWVQPVMKGYRLACCDCGLVHEMEFGVLRKTKDNADGSWKGTKLDPEKYRVEFRASRNKRATGQVRRHKGTRT